MVQATAVVQPSIATLNCMDLTFLTHPLPRPQLHQLPMDMHHLDLLPRNSMKKSYSLSKEKLCLKHYEKIEEKQIFILSAEANEPKIK